MDNSNFPSFLKKRARLQDLAWINFFILIDQASKWTVRSWNFYYLCNSQYGWGVYLPKVLFWPLWFLLVFWLFSAWFEKKYSPFFLGLILAGALSNAFDRLLWGCVIDFIQLPFWPIFNLADVFITVGALGVLAKNMKLL